jgi:hypothetical protein
MSCEYSTLRRDADFVPFPSVPEVRGMFKFKWRIKKPGLFSAAPVSVSLLTSLAYFG